MWLLISELWYWAHLLWEATQPVRVTPSWSFVLCFKNYRTGEGQSKTHSPTLGKISLLVCSLLKILGVIWNQCPYLESRERLKKEAGHSRFAGGSFKEQGNLPTRLVLGRGKMSRSLHLSEDLDTTSLSQSCDFGAGFGGKEFKQNVHYKDRRGGEEIPVARSNWLVNQLSSCVWTHYKKSQWSPQ